MILQARLVLRPTPNYESENDTRSWSCEPAICETRRLVAIGLSSRSVERCRCDLPRRSGRDSTHSDLLARSQGVARWNFRRISEGTKEVPRNPEETAGLGGLFPSRLISSGMFPALLCCKMVGLVAIKGILMLALTVQKKFARLKLEFSGSAVDTVFVLGLPWHSSVLFDPVSAYIYVLYNTHTYIDKYIMYICVLYTYIYTRICYKTWRHQDQFLLYKNVRQIPNLCPCPRGFFQHRHRGTQCRGA